ncbi:MAG: TetR/AcrR family transcriptional regulator [Nitrospinae bacterium]|nr:TetR/AcrR family transcriptional regulator [Nitrospinota bacterium]
MKISKAQKDKNRQKLISAAVDVITEKGFQSATMREIAKKAGLAEATIYKYFPTKEKLVYAYYEQTQTVAVERAAKVKGVEKFTLRERFQLLIDTGLEAFLNDREFVRKTFGVAFISPAGYFGGTSEVKRLFANAVADLVESAEIRREIPEQPFKAFVPALSWDYYLGVVTFWLKDESENFSDTTLLVEKSLAVVEAVLKSGVLSTGAEFLSFLYRSHVSRWLDVAGKAFCQPGKNEKKTGRRHAKK